jgi:hypothetical protein
MSRRQLPAAFYALVAMELVVLPLLFLAVGQRLDPRRGGLLVLGLVLIGVARRSRIAWGLLLLMTLMLLCAVAVTAPTATPSLSGIGQLLYNAGVLALLLSPSLRRHVLGPPSSAAPAGA